MNYEQYNPNAECYIPRDISPNELILAAMSRIYSTGGIVEDF